MNKELKEKLTVLQARFDDERVKKASCCVENEEQLEALQANHKELKKQAGMLRDAVKIEITILTGAYLKGSAHALKQALTNYTEYLKGGLG